MLRVTGRIAGFLMAGALALAPTTGESAAGVRMGPWLMEPRRDAITLMLERATPGNLRVRVWPSNDPGASREFVDEVPLALHEVRLAGLSAGTRYAYETTGVGLEPITGTFTTAPANAVSFRFVIYGDTRSDAATHTRMAQSIRAEGADFVLHTGDLVADGRDDAQWRRFFTIERDLLRDAPLVPVIGNHEIMRPGSGGIDAFRRYVHCDPASPSPELDYPFAYGNVRFVVLNAFDDWTSSSRRTWLDAELNRARAEVPDGFVIVAMHWGLCSCGPHGENHAARTAGIDDVLRRHHVDLLVSGHDHIFERGDDDGLRYLVSGGGGAPLYHRARIRSYARAFASEHHFVRVDAEADHLVFTAVRADGSVLDRCTLRHTGWDCPPSPIAPHLTAADLLMPNCTCRAGSRPVPAGGLVSAAVLVVLVLRRRRARSVILRRL